MVLRSVGTNTRRRGVRLRRGFRALAAALALVGAAGVAGATVGGKGDAALRPGVLRLRSGDVNLTGETDARASARRAVPRNAGQAPWRIIVQMDGPMTRARRQALRNAGVELGDYLPDHAYFARADGAALARLDGLGFVTWAGVPRTAWKVDPTIGARDYATPERLAIRDAGTARVVVTLFEEGDLTRVIGAVRGAGGREFGVHAAGARLLLDAEIPSNSAGVVAALADVQYVEDAPEGELRFDSYRWVVQSNQQNFTPVWNRGLHGEGQVAGIIDSTVKISHCSFFDQFFPVGPMHRKVVAQRDAQSGDSHGTHVAGILAGDHGSYGVYDASDGIAFAARLSLGSTANLFATPTGMYDHLLDAHDDGARVHSNSYGDGSTNAYTTWCAQIDQFTWEHEDDLVVFAVSNTSPQKSPENALNVLAVGAGQDAPFQNSFCFGSAGPTFDGRMKPEVFAPGCGILSANSTTSCSFFAQNGTSMACPAAAGSAVLVRQYFTDGFYPTGVADPQNALTPSGALLRAVLINSAVDMAGIFGYPSATEGWGRILLDNTLYFPGDQRKLLIQDVRNAAGLGTTETSSTSVTVLSGTTPLNITLAFTHPPAAVNASNPVANDLDLQVIGPTGTVYRGNRFSGGQSLPGTTTDPKNTVEQFLLTSPATGTYQVTVNGTAVNVGTQGFALVVSGDIDLCLPPVVPDPPQAQTVNPGDPVTFAAVAYGTGTLTYQWIKDLEDIPGATGQDYTIAAAYLADQGDYSVRVTGDCGTVTTLGAALVVDCIADFDGNGFANGDDFDSFVVMFELGDESADVDLNGFVNGDDFDAFTEVFVAGC